MPSTNVVCGSHETVPGNMAYCQSYVPYSTCQPNLLFTDLEEGILALPSLEDCDCNHIFAKKMDQLIGQLRCPELDSYYSIEHLQLADGLVLLEDAGRESGVVSMYVQWNWDLAILMDDVDSIRAWKKFIKPRQVLHKLLSEVDGALGRTLSEGVKHTVKKQPCWGAELCHV